ncbi:MAG: SRPBCC family protein [Armatimonadetes bacterium]|nr:SRPBCC family protein [Armatimonadota bacterium]
MPTVETSTWIDALIGAVYAIAKDNESFPEYMDDVSSLVVVERDGDRVVSDWVGVISTFGLKIRWRQEDIWNDSTHQCTFSQISGDYDKLEGTWRFTEENCGTRFDSDVEYEYVVPGIGPLIKKVIHNIVVKNMDGVLAAIKARAES